MPNATLFLHLMCDRDTNITSKTCGCSRRDWLQTRLDLVIDAIFPKIIPRTLLEERVLPILEDELVLWRWWRLWLGRWKLGDMCDMGGILGALSCQVTGKCG